MQPSEDHGLFSQESALMKVVVINGSPHGGKGNTALILDPFLDGMKAAGAQVKIFETKAMNVKPCQEVSEYVRQADRSGA
jgi:multimeric flavodoxin WrbA